ncbi:hypothetical protein C8R47DRAFT_1208797 [Mycena vitilis]|nr:hypothetical protein C8R47DRAFT_1208797 [Mycena vitilis]
MTRRSKSPDDIKFTFEDYMQSNSFEAARDVSGQPTFYDVAIQTDLTPSFPNVMGIRAHSFGEQFSSPSLAPTGGSRRRAQSDNSSFQIPDILHTSHYDNYAVADEDSPPSDLPPITVPHPEHPLNASWDASQWSESTQPPLSPLHLSSGWNSAPGSDLPPITIPQPEKSSAPWVAAQQWNDPVNPPLSPLLLSPGWRSGPESDTSSPPSSSHSRFLSLSPFSPTPPNLDGVPSPYNQTSPPDAEPSIRGGIKRLSERSSSHSSYPSPRADALPMGALSIQDGTPGEPNYSQFVTNYAPESSGSHSGFLLPGSNPFGGPSWPLDDASTAAGPFDGRSHLYPPSYSNQFPLPSSGPASSNDHRDFAEGSNRGSLEVGGSYGQFRVSVDCPIPDPQGIKTGRSATRRAQRHRDASLYRASVAGPSTSAVGATPSGPDGLYVQLIGNVYHPAIQPASAGRTPIIPDDARSLSMARDADQTQSPEFRHSIATEATLRAAAARRKDPNKRGAYVCEYCHHDFTARHNLESESLPVLDHLKSHFSDKQYECGQCGQAFVTAHVLKRHKLTCKAAASSVKKKKRAT